MTPRLVFANPLSALLPYRFPLAIGCNGLLVVCCVALLANAGAAQDLTTAKKLFFKGEYQKAAAALEGRRRHTPETLTWLSLAQEEAGDLSAAASTILSTANWQRYPMLVNRLGEIELARADYKNARQYFADAVRRDSTFLEARLNLGEMAYLWGDHQLAESMLQYFIALYKATPYPDALIDFLTARACIPLQRFKDANDLFYDANKLAPEDWRILVRWGKLFLEKYNFPDARRTFTDALAINPNAVEAKIGLAAAQENDEMAAAVAIAQELVEKYPERLAVLHYAARLYLTVGDRGKAKKYAAQAQKLAPNHLETLTVLGQIALLESDIKAFQSLADKVFEINPAYSQFYTSSGDILANRYLFAEAAVRYRQALQLNPDDAKALAGLGTTLSRLAKLDEAKSYLEKSFKIDAYNVWTGNLLNLFDSYAEYDTVHTPHFVIRLHRDDRQIVGPYAAALAESAYADIVPRYGARLDFPVTLEIFPKHDDFAVRCFGLPGAPAFLGICFGPLITMNSPRARPVGTFNWSETLWHEFAHVVHLTLSNNRVPRWLAEGISVYEATRSHTSWDMNMQLAMIAALQKDAVIPLAELDGGFTGDPVRVTFSYFEASQMVSFIVAHYGMPALLQLLRDFRDGKETPAAIKNTLGVNLSEFDSIFRDYLKKRFAYDEIDFNWDEAALPQEPVAREKVLRRALADRPNSFFATLELGTLLVEQNKAAEAIQLLELARKIFPDYVGRNNAYRGLARAYLAKGDSALALSQLQMLARRDGKDFATALEYATLAQKLNKENLATEGFLAAIEVSPYDIDVHRRLGEIYLHQNDGVKAAREFGVVLALKPTDKAGAHCNLAAAYLLANQKAQAKRHALLALEIAPTYQRALDILLQSSN